MLCDLRAVLRLAGVAFASAGALACGDNGGVRCPADATRCVWVEAGDSYVEIQTALIEAEPGDAILLASGVHHLRLGLSLTVDGVTLRGEGMDESILSFAGQIDGAQGLSVTGDDFTIEDLAIEDPAGDGLKIEGTTGVTIRRTRVEWTGGGLTENGAYGLYPVQCDDVLIEGSVAKGASDAGIYVGQSTRIIVRDNLAEKNVAGIEIENSSDADVYGNLATNNTGGVLIFNLPGLPVSGGARTRVFDNDIVENNHINFAPIGNIVGLVPAGTGIAMIAAHEIEVFGNRIRDNQTSNSAVISYETTMRDFGDPNYDPYSDTVTFRDNEYAGGGDLPSGELGFLLVAALGTVLSPVVIPDIVFDGYADPEKSDASGGLLPAYKICMARNGDADFANLDVVGEFANVSLDKRPHECEHPPLAEVVLGARR